MTCSRLLMVGVLCATVVLPGCRRSATEDR